MCLGLLLLNDFSFVQSLEALFTLFVTLLTTPWILKTLAFSILVGSVIALIEKSGGVGGFIEYMLYKKSFISSPRSALLLSYLIGVVIFIESSVTALIAGAVGKPFCEKYKIPREKLAFVCDSTSAPVSSLLALNGWGALILGLISAQISLGVIAGEGISILLHALVYNFYAMSALVVTFIAIWFSVDLGLMKKAVYKPQTVFLEKNIAGMHLMIVPIALMVFFVFFYLYVTGDGEILKGSGSSAIFYTLVSTLFIMFFYYVGGSYMPAKIWAVTSVKGAKKLFPIALILLFAFAIGKVTNELKTGLYLASLANESLHVGFLAGVVFLLSATIAFTTGTSWGTFSIMIPIAIPMAVGMDGNVALAIGAVISGGVFGDHCSPISDTSIISSMAAECGVIEHVQTQLPYALISACIACVLFILFGFIG